ncbi:hypothetical protein L9F63_016944, partial [Diploptera punctata]
DFAVLPSSLAGLTVGPNTTTYTTELRLLYKDIEALVTERNLFHDANGLFVMHCLE